MLSLVSPAQPISVNKGKQEVNKPKHDRAAWIEFDGQSVVFGECALTKKTLRAALLSYPRTIIQPAEHIDTNVKNSATESCQRLYPKTAQELAANSVAPFNTNSGTLPPRQLLGRPFFIIAVRWSLMIVNVAGAAILIAFLVVSVMVGEVVL